MRLHLLFFCLVFLVLLNLNFTVYGGVQDEKQIKVISAHRTNKFVTGSFSMNVEVPEKDVILFLRVDGISIEEFLEAAKKKEIYVYWNMIKYNLGFNAWAKELKLKEEVICPWIILTFTIPKTLLKVRLQISDYPSVLVTPNKEITEALIIDKEIIEALVSQEEKEKESTKIPKENEVIIKGSFIHKNGTPLVDTQVTLYEVFMKKGVGFRTELSYDKGRLLNPSVRTDSSGYFEIIADRKLIKQIDKKWVLIFRVGPVDGFGGIDRPIIVDFDKNATDEYIKNLQFLELYGIEVKL